MQPDIKEWLDYFTKDPIGKQLINVLFLSIILDCSVYLFKDKLFPVKEIRHDERESVMKTLGCSF